MKSRRFSCLLFGCVAGLLAAGCVTEPGTATVRVKGQPIRVGALLPLAGKYALYGDSTLHGIECAAGKQMPCTSPMPLEVVAKDSGTDGASAAAAVEALVTKDRVVAIIGPLLSTTAEGAARKAEALQVPLLSLSQRDGIAEIGDYVFRVGLNAASQVETMAKYAVKERGFKQIAIVYPNNPYGQLFRQAFRDAVTARGGAIVAEKGYSPELANIIDARDASGQETYSASRPKPGTMTTGGEVVPLAESEQPMPVFPKIRGAEAVFIPDSYRNVVTLVKHGGDPFGGAVLLGISRWNSPGILEAASRLEGAVFVDGFFRDSGDNATQQFVRNFAEVYRMDPTILEAQAFDAMRLVAQVVRGGARTPGAIRDGLSRIKNFRGVTGRMHFDPAGDALKQLYILTIKGGMIQEVAAGQGRGGPQSPIGKALEQRRAATSRPAAPVPPAPVRATRPGRPELEM
ncbi:MAG: penicillin-binding protein activator [Deltaproteobacteria bacterium]|nr:penicillin-binding protein activator [Deltaproteobacteria bacterium]